MSKEDVLIEKSPLTLDEEKEKETMQAVKEGFDGVIDFHQVRAEDIKLLTARLAQVLAQEADCLEKMQVSQIAPLQKEKVMLTNALALIKKQLPKDGSFADTLSEEERDDLENVIMIFNDILEENYARLNMARLVNQRVVEAITDVVKEQTTQDAYNDKGKTGQAHDKAIPISVNEKI